MRDNILCLDGAIHEAPKIWLRLGFKSSPRVRRAIESAARQWLAGIGRQGCAVVYAARLILSRSAVRLRRQMRDWFCMSAWMGRAPALITIIKCLNVVPVFLFCGEGRQ